MLGVVAAAAAAAAAAVAARQRGARETSLRRIGRLYDRLIAEAHKQLRYHQAELASAWVKPRLQRGHQLSRELSAAERLR